ncbi:hypothetical protein ABFY59_28625 [Priestia aryabhattai]|uniref:hypothetical protein n=1 Tax=Priestia aryabhattai TaxID=412384 RepID=UPI003D2A7EF1
MLKDIASIVQICFYVVGATIAILTYRSAKKGLLNTVNTEYQKRVMDHLQELSESLYRDIEDKESEKSLYYHYYKHMYFDVMLKWMAERFKKHMEEGKDPAHFVYRGTSHPLAVRRLFSLRKQITSNPFIPNDISIYVVNFLYKIEITVIEVTQEMIDVVTEYFREIEVSSYNPNTLMNYDQNRAMIRMFETKMKEQGFGKQEVEAEIYKIRIMIKQHLESFNPLK